MVVRKIKLIEMMQNKPHQKGNITLEATIIFPALMVVLCSLIFFSMFIYQKLVVIDTAVYTVKQRAVNWDNSYRDLDSGKLTDKKQSDGLYWRLFHDFDNSSLAVEKNNIAQMLAENMLKTGLFQEEDNVQVSYSNAILKRTVTVDIDKTINLPKWLRQVLGKNISTKATAQIAEPVEFIRTADLLEEVISRYSGNSSGGGSQDQNGKEEKTETESDQKKTKVVYATRRSYEGTDKVYHYPGCFHIKNIKDENLVTFDSPEAAIGYRLCKHCVNKN